MNQSTAPIMASAAKIPRRRTQRWFCFIHQRSGESVRRTRFPLFAIALLRRTSTG